MSCQDKWVETKQYIYLDIDLGVYGKESIQVQFSLTGMRVFADNLV